MMRPLLSYDDITTPQERPVAQAGSHLPPPNGPPPKKRKTNPRQTNGRGRGGRPQNTQHWDDPGAQEPQMSYDVAPPHADATGVADVEVEELEEEEAEESRALTQAEIWDDSALIDAWNSAMAEYKEFHGPGDKWKEEPTKKSPLWYNVPPVDVKGKQKTAEPPVASASSEKHGTDSAPFDFDTFVPAHDPSLAPAPAQLHAEPSSDAWMSSAPGEVVSQDEAFSRALSAMYWSGYWTAVYHSHQIVNPTASAATVEEKQTGEEQNEDDDDDDDDYIPTQR